MSQKMLLTECNYKIYDKKLLTIIKAFEEWRSKCANIFSNYSIHVLFDHKNFEHFMIIKQLNRWQVKWIEFFFEFNFQITYRLKIQNTKSDNLIRRFQKFFVDNFDEKKQFNNQVIFKSKNLNLEMRNAIKLVEQIYQLKSETTKLVIIIYFNLIKFIIFEIFKFDIDEKDFDDENDNFDAENIFIVNQSFTNAINFSKNQFDAINFSNFSSTFNAINSSTFNETNFVQNLSMQSNIEFDTNNINNFLFRIKKAYKKNKKLQVIIKTKKNDNRKISAKLIKKKIRLKLSDCEIKHEFFWIKKRLHMSRKFFL